MKKLSNWVYNKLKQRKYKELYKNNTMELYKLKQDTPTTAKTVEEYLFG